MTSIRTWAGRYDGAALQRFFWLHPEWWSIALCGSAWVALLVHAWQQTGHAGHHRMSSAAELRHWMLMIAAMMLPFILHRVQVTAECSLWGRRHRAMVGFLVGYFAPWLALGLVAVALRAVLWPYAHVAAALAFAAAALWTSTPMHARALMGCHRRRPLAPTGWRADYDCFRFGNTIGVACVWSCWPVMLACALAGHDLIAIAGGMIVGGVERLSYRPRTRKAIVGTLMIASYYSGLAVWEHNGSLRLPPVRSSWLPGRVSLPLLCASRTSPRLPVPNPSGRGPG